MTKIEECELIDVVRSKQFKIMKIVLRGLNNSDHWEFYSGSKTSLVLTVNDRSIVSAEVKEQTQWFGLLSKEVSIIRFQASYVTSPYLGCVKIFTSIGAFAVSIDDGLELARQVPQMGSSQGVLNSFKVESPDRGEYNSGRGEFHFKN